MSDLETRKMLAEFAGWTEIRTWRDHYFQKHGDWKEPKIRYIVGNRGLDKDAMIPAYESDPAAACSLLPRIYAECFKRQDMEVWRGLHFALGSHGPMCCPGLITNAVRKLKETADA
ncbi:unnamed protein product [marine sediment metagenome]|uniref:Uncharacterized protein n=1 Tax=marine sediment metagenome TaxID=412755 RepID=X0Y2D2_9ZZZZ